MMLKHKIHRSHNAHKRDILLLTSLLRLRTTPTVPYSSIAEILLRTLPSPISKLAKQSGAKPAHTVSSSAATARIPDRNITNGEEDIAVTRLEMEKILENPNNRKIWLANQLEDMFNHGETWKSTEWKMACQWDSNLVGEMLKILGLSHEYGVVSNEEMVVQIKWRKEGDWRAGSEPLRRYGEELRQEKLYCKVDDSRDKG